MDTFSVVTALTLFFIFLALEIPIGFCLMGAGLLGIMLLGFTPSATAILAASPFDATAKYMLLIIPMFLLLGAVVSHAGIARRIFQSARALIGWLPGGLAVSTIFACALFGAISGSSAADVATIGRVSMTEMRRHGYTPRQAGAVIAAGGTLAILIPPSIPLVMFGVLTGEPIGALLLAGLIPGLLTALAFTAYLVWRFRNKRDTLEAAEPVAAAISARLSRTRRVANHRFIGVVYAVILIGIIIGGIYSGIFTSTEAAAVGAFAAVLMGVPIAALDGRRPGQVLGAALSEAGQLTSMIFVLLIGSAVFTYFLNLSGFAVSLTSWVLDMNLTGPQVVAISLLMLIPLGMFLDGMSMLLIVVPLIYPLVDGLGVDGVWFGILVVMLIEIGLITPPFGINVFVIAGISDELALEDAFIGVIPFILIQVALVLLIFFFPEIVRFLPDLMAGS